MYVTRPLSLCKKNPASLSQPPPEGPNSGYLVIQDEESETYCCLGCKDHAVYDMPLPQNKLLTVRYESGSAQHRQVSHDDVYFIPVLNQPLSSNRYYTIKPHGRHKGEAYTNSKDEDVMTCCFCCNFVRDIGTGPLEPHDIYQQVEIFRHDKICSSGFSAKSVTPDGYPPYFLRRKGWGLRTSTPNYCHELGEANGLNVALRSQLPTFDFPLSYKDTEPIVVGKWYTPFMFIKEGNLRDQMKLSMFYEITLQQKWQQIFACENHGNNKGNAVDVDVIVQSEAISIGPGREVLPGDMQMVDGVMWYRSVGGVEGEVSVGLSPAIVERMKWEQERVGSTSGREREVRVKTVQEFGGVGEWRRFGCYVLVERFVLKRMDGSLLMTHEFKHSHQIRSKWE